MKEKANGDCYLCGANLGKIAMKNHLFKLHGEEKIGEKCSLLKIEGVFNKEYWLYIDIPMDKTLSDVDAFLREIWLECCGHMSMFFHSGYNEMDMGKKLRTIPVGEKFFHHYDMGTTTETHITVMGSVIRKPRKDTVRLLARNTPPVFQCEDCGKRAEYMLMEPDDGYEFPFYCAECSEKYDEEMMSPIANSPRVGVCGYTGDLDVFEFNPASIGLSKR